MNCRTVVYPGSFDPITNGHLDIIRRGLQMFDHLIVAVAHANDKNSLFPVQERVQMIRDVLGDSPQLTVESFDGLLVRYVRSRGASAILRGLRAVSDFEYEFQLAQMNHVVDGSIETLFMMTSVDYGYLRSSIVKEVARLGGPVDAYVPPLVAQALQRKFAEQDDAARRNRK